MTDLADLADKIDPRKSRHVIVADGVRYANWPSSDSDLIAASDALRSLAVARAMQWQPIETAPRDETHILLRYNSAYGEKYTAEGWWNGKDGWERHRDIYARAIGWVPLPGAPITPSAREEMVETVARAIAKAGYGNDPSVTAWVDANWPSYIDEARAAIAALGVEG